MIERQKPTGDLYIPQDPASNQNAWLYSHGIAALALCEAYGMTQDPELKKPAQLAVNFMIESQEPQRGGWRYRPGVGSDTSVTGWFMMALKSAQLAGLEVPKSAFEKMSRYVQASQVSSSEPHLFRYNPFAPDTPEQRHGLKPTHVMTSVGLLMRLYLGWKRDLPEMQAGTDYLLEYVPELGTPQQTRRDTYYWYYATQVLFHMGGERWKKWNDKLRPLLLNSQVVEGDLAGSWDPYLPSSDLWARYGGRLYVTTLTSCRWKFTIATCRYTKPQRSNVGRNKRSAVTAGGTKLLEREPCLSMECCSAATAFDVLSAAPKPAPPNCFDEWRRP